MKMKRSAYLQRVIEVEQGTFTTLVFGTNGGIGRECDLFVKNLASKLALKQNEQYGNMTWLRTKLSFETVKAALLCVRALELLSGESRKTPLTILD